MVCTSVRLCLFVSVVAVGCGNSDSPAIAGAGAQAAGKGGSTAAHAGGQASGRGGTGGAGDNAEAGTSANEIERDAGAGVDAATGGNGGNGGSGGRGGAPGAGPTGGVQAPADAGGGGSPSDADAGSSSGALSPARIEEIRKCMGMRWGNAETRLVSDVLDDFEACSEAAEQNSDNYVSVVSGWARPDMDDGSMLRRVTKK